MQLTQANLDRARGLLAEATDEGARERLTWVVAAFEWVLQDPGLPSPAEAAAKPDEKPDEPEKKPAKPKKRKA